MFKSKKKLNDYRKWIKEIEKVIDSEADKETKLQVIKKLIYVIKIHDLLN